MDAEHRLSTPAYCWNAQAVSAAAVAPLLPDAGAGRRGLARRIAGLDTSRRALASPAPGGPAA
jgi:hypothetical protein